MKILENYIEIKHIKAMLKGKPEEGWKGIQRYHIPYVYLLMGIMCFALAVYLSTHLR